MNPSMRPRNKDGNESMGDMESVQQQLKCSNNDIDLTTTTSPLTSSTPYSGANENTNVWTEFLLQS
jgi:hypothetical protein